MEKTSNYFLISITIILLLAIITTKTVMALNERHEEKSIYAMKTKVEYYAKRCYLENNCTGTITLNDLYTKGYITSEVVDPITKEVINPNIKINYDNNVITINWE
jgi:competence protein ComGC